MKLMIIVKPDADLNGLLNDLRNAGYGVETFAIYPQWVFVPNATPENFTLKDHPAIESYRAETVYKPHVSHPVSIDSGTARGYWGGGNWQLLRMIVRDNPFFQPGTRRVVLPVTGTYNCERTGQGVDIYVIDTGIQTNHDDFANLEGRVTHVRQMDNQTYGDAGGHGTACASQAGGLNCGFAKNAMLFSSQGISSFGSGSSSDIAAACQAVLDSYNSRSGLNRPAVLNASFGAELPTGDVAATNEFNQMFQPLMNAGITCVAASGNSKKNMDQMDQLPAEIPNMISVGGTTPGDDTFNTGYYGTTYSETAIDIVAGAQHCWMAYFTGAETMNYGTNDGTSFAAPAVVGALACMLEGYNRLTSLTQVQALTTYLLAEATTGRLRKHWQQPNMPDRILYLNPAAASAIPTIPGLTKKA